MNLMDMARLGGKYQVPILVQPYLNNAFHVPHTEPPYPDPRGDVLVDAMNKMRMSPRGGIVAGGEMTDKTSLMHEIGHSLVKDPTPTFWDKMYLPLVGTGAALVAGRIFPEHKRSIGLANIGLQAASTIPSLLNEYRASAKAKELEPDVDSGKLNSMLGQHVKNMVLKRLAVPVAAHGIDALLQ